MGIPLGHDKQISRMWAAVEKKDKYEQSEHLRPYGSKRSLSDSLKQSRPESRELKEEVSQTYPNQ